MEGRLEEWCAWQGLQVKEPSLGSRFDPFLFFSGSLAEPQAMFSGPQMSPVLSFHFASFAFLPVDYILSLTLNPNPKASGGS